MLILTRRPGEALVINHDIVVRVMGVNGMQVRIGVEAPTDVEVNREEVEIRKLQERSNERGT